MSMQIKCFFLTLPVQNRLLRALGQRRVLKITLSPRRRKNYGMVYVRKRDSFLECKLPVKRLYVKRHNEARISFPTLIPNILFQSIYHEMIDDLRIADKRIYNRRDFQSNVNY